ncbi:MAG: hypothetical protein E3J42_02645 [Dehalococcoidia bacterium]|nr:MAG: hypothetical protein E3J42_02645 [Dehalococcoidia bacterium]
MSGENERIKSALEIALEKAQKLGALSEEERQRLRDEELAAAGEALAKRYLNGLPLRDIDVELGRRGGDDRQIISRNVLSRLVDKIDMEHIAGAERILAAIQHLSGHSGVVQSIKDLLKEYESATEKAWRENRSALEAAKRNELELKGISGSAVDPAIETSPEWLQIRQRLDSHYQQRLEEIKRRCKNL